MNSFPAAMKKDPEMRKNLNVLESLTNLEKSLFCIYCQKFPTSSPLILPCNHICCRNCLPNLHQRCSNCSQTFTQLPTNHFANSFLENIWNSVRVIPNLSHNEVVGEDVDKEVEDEVEEVEEVEEESDVKKKTTLLNTRSQTIQQTSSNCHDQTASAEILSYDIFSTATSGQKNYQKVDGVGLALPRVKEIEPSNLFRYPSSGIICSASVPQSPPYFSKLDDEIQNDDVVSCHQPDQTNTNLPQSNSLSTNVEGNNATQPVDFPQTPYSQLSKSQLTLESESSQSFQEAPKTEYIENLYQLLSSTHSLPSYQNFIPDTYVAAESSFVDEEASQLSPRLTLSQNHPISVDPVDDNHEKGLKSIATVVSDTYHDDQMTLDIDMSDNEFADSDSVLSDEINHQPNKIVILHTPEKTSSLPSYLSKNITATTYMDEETNAMLIAQTQTIIHHETDGNPKVVLDTYDEIPPAITARDHRPIPTIVPSTLETNAYDLSSSEDDYDNYLQFSAKKKKTKRQKLVPAPENITVNLVHDTLSSLPILGSGCSGTLISGTIQKSATLVESSDECISDSLDDDKLEQDVPPEISSSPILKQNTVNIEVVAPLENIQAAATLSTKPNSTSCCTSITHAEQIQSNLSPTVQKHELEEDQEDQEYNVETQIEIDNPEIGGYLYGAGIDSAVRRFTPQKQVPQVNDIRNSSPPSTSKKSENKSSEKIVKKLDMNTESYSTQDSLPTRFTWSNNITTPTKEEQDVHSSYHSSSSPPPHPPHPSHPPPQHFSNAWTPPRHNSHPEETHSTDEVASWSDSLFDRLHDIKKMINQKTGLVSPPTTTEKSSRKKSVHLHSPPIPPKPKNGNPLYPPPRQQEQNHQIYYTSPHVTLKRFTSTTSDVFEEVKDNDGDYEQREEWIDRINPMKRSSPLSKQENHTKYNDFNEIPEFPRPVNASSSARLDLQFSENTKTSPIKERQNINDLIGNILKKSETISSDESDILKTNEAPSSPVISIRKSPIANTTPFIPKIVKMSSLSPHTIQLLQKCVEKGYMTVQCKDDFVPYESSGEGLNSNTLITLVESQKTKQGIPLCKRTLTYLKSLCLGSHWIVDSPSWLNECLIQGQAVRPDKFEIGGSIHDTHVRGPSRSRLCIRDSMGRSSLLKGYVFYLMTSMNSNESPSPSSLTEEDVRWMIYFCGGTVLNQRWCDKCLANDECETARRENRLIILDLTNPSKSKKRRLEEESSPGLISLSPALQLCGNCGKEFVSDNCFLKQPDLSGVIYSPLLWLINVICAHKLLRTND